MDTVGAPLALPQQHTLALGAALIEQTNLTTPTTTPQFIAVKASGQKRRPDSGDSLLESPIPSKVIKTKDVSTLEQIPQQQPDASHQTSQSTESSEASHQSAIVQEAKTGSFFKFFG